MSPVPEAGAYSMLLARLGLVGLASRRKRDKPR
ncbi:MULTISPECIES: PEP-CTERM sorting domain-containing protein [unclassified Janthinobacterium]|nr:MULTISPECIES: PEP-CTERM sorting domain-containing protein [unclassified Janthinobacterium]MEC5164136.1 MYXO-CTERM domain-containing protein [Janthinobacterium sp. CG_S6]